MKIKIKKEVTEVRLTLSIEEARELHLMAAHTGGLGVAYAIADALENADVVSDKLENFMEKHYPEYIDKDVGELQF